VPFCPQCRFEYVRGIATCPDCGVALVEEMREGDSATDAPPAPRTLENMRIIFEGDLGSCDDLIRMLRAEGITAVLERIVSEPPPEPPPTPIQQLGIIVIPPIPTRQVVVCVMVTEDDWERRKGTIQRCVARVTGEGAPPEDIPEE